HRMPEVCVAHAGEPPKYYDVLFQPIREQDGIVDAVLLQSMDITDQVLARRRAEDGELRMRRMLEAIPIGIFFWSEARGMEEANPRRQAQRLQVQKLESLGVLAGGIAHDFNNLLTIIIGGASAALLKLPPASPAAQGIDSALVGARRAAELTRQLLAYTGKGH